MSKLQPNIAKQKRSMSSENLPNINFNASYKKVVKVAAAFYFSANLIKQKSASTAPTDLATKFG
jgi:hypothetical protein